LQFVLKKIVPLQKFFLTQIKYKMKRLFALLVMAGLCFVACGPSAEEIAKEEQRKADSIAQVQAAEEEAARLAAEEEAANAKKPATVKKTTAEPAKTEPAKPAEDPAKKSKTGVKQTN
jgi:hypothetical protein